MKKCRPAGRWRPESRQGGISSWHQSRNGGTRKPFGLKERTGHDPQTRRRQVPALFPQEESQDRQAPQPGDFQQPQGGGKARARRAVFQAPLAALPSLSYWVIMNILVACDSFKDALSSEAVCRATAAGLKKSHPDAIVTQMPLSDGGEGLLDVLGQALGLTWIEMQVADPLGRPVTGRYGLSADGATGVVEMAQASGLQLLTLDERDPRLTSTFGTGQLLADARARGARHALLATGGSATNDAGIGAAAALGWGFLDSSGKAVRTDGGHLINIARLVPAPTPFAKIEVLCD